MIKAILFDKDGTLIDFKETWLPITREVVAYICHAYKVQDRYYELLESIGVHGDKLDATGVLACKTSTEIAIKWYAIIGPEENLESFLNKVKNLFKKYVEKRVQEIDFIQDVRNSLYLLKEEGYKLGIATADTKEITEIMLKGLGVYEMFSFIGTEDGKLQPKPHPEMLECFCRAVEIDKKEVVIVGDTICDMQFGMNAGVRTIGVLGSTEKSILGIYTKEIINSVAELPKYLGVHI